MDTKKSAETKKKKIKITIIFCVISIIVMLVVGFFAGNLIYRMMQKDEEQKNSNVHTLYISEKVDSKEDEKVLTVELDGENQINQVNETNDGRTNNQEEKPKIVDAPYYIKVNNEANVVTVYKKDSKR